LANRRVDRVGSCWSSVETRARNATATSFGSGASRRGGPSSVSDCGRMAGDCGVRGHAKLPGQGGTASGCVRVWTPGGLMSSQ
jgi:hypothetical protein